MKPLYHSESPRQALRNNPPIRCDIPATLAILCGSVTVHTMMNRNTHPTQQPLYWLELAATERALAKLDQDGPWFPGRCESVRIRIRNAEDAEAMAAGLQLAAKLAEA